MGPWMDGWMDVWMGGMWVDGRVVLSENSSPVPLVVVRHRPSHPIQAIPWPIPWLSAAGSSDDYDDDDDDDDNGSVWPSRTSPVSARQRWPRTLAAHSSLPPKVPLERPADWKVTGPWGGE